jgi:hypothetical protein
VGCQIHCSRSTTEAKFSSKQQHAARRSGQQVWLYHNTNSAGMAGRLLKGINHTEIEGVTISNRNVLALAVFALFLDESAPLLAGTTASHPLLCG